MRCTSCGYEMADGTSKCLNCGAVYKNHDDQSISILIMGILSLYFSGIVGLILAIITKNKVKAHLEQGGSLTGKAKVGNTLATVGLVVSIVTIAIAILMIIAYLIYIIFFFLAYGSFVGFALLSSMGY